MSKPLSLHCKMLYRRELLNLKNPENYRLAVELLHDSLLPTKSDIGLLIEYCYHEEFGPKEEFEKVKKRLGIL